MKEKQHRTEVAVYGLGDGFRIPMILTSPPLLVFTILWLLIWPAPWYAKVVWVALMGVLWRRKSRFAKSYYNSLIAAFWGIAQEFLPSLRSGSVATAEPAWSASAREYWRQIYAYRCCPAFWKVLWVFLFLSGLFLVLDIAPILFGGQLRFVGWVLPVALAYVTAASVFLVAQKRAHRLSREQQLATAIGRASLFFRDTCKTLPVDLRLYRLTGMAHPSRPVSVTGTFLRFLWASVPLYPAFLVKEVWVSIHSGIPGTLETLISVLLLFFLLFSWLITVLRTGVPLCRFDEPSQDYQLCHHVFYEDLCGAKTV